MSRLIRMDHTGHTTLAEWTADDPASVEAAVAAFREELEQRLDRDGHARAGPRRARARAAARRGARDHAPADRRRIAGRRGSARRAAGAGERLLAPARGRAAPAHARAAVDADDPRARRPVRPRAIGMVLLSPLAFAGLARRARARVADPGALRPARRERRAAAAAAPRRSRARLARPARRPRRPRRARAARAHRARARAGPARHVARGRGGRAARQRPARFCWCVKATDPAALGDRVAHLLLALRTDEEGFATVANLAFTGARWRVRRRLPKHQRRRARRGVRFA